LLFKEVELLEASIEVVSYVVPGVAIEVDIFVGPQIREVAIINVRNYLKDCDEVGALLCQGSGDFVGPGKQRAE
jgi:acyl-CoA reductase-like NAD-dependent aldehyde dehydrogenase